MYSLDLRPVIVNLVEQPIQTVSRDISASLSLSALPFRFGKALSFFGGSSEHYARQTVGARARGTRPWAAVRMLELCGARGIWLPAYFWPSLKQSIPADRRSVKRGCRRRPCPDFNRRIWNTHTHTHTCVILWGVCVCVVGWLIGAASVLYETFFSR